uniref:Uncharacterized protein n=1 Tax=Rhizophora mucronata TaxID=61149 RepID=A0A2P2J372_RHIMU
MTNSVLRLCRIAFSLSFNRWLHIGNLVLELLSNLMVHFICLTYACQTTLQLCMVEMVVLLPNSPR